MKTKNGSNKTSSSSNVIAGSLADVISRVFGVSADKVKDSPAARKALVNAANDLKGREVMAITLRAVGMSYRKAGKMMGVSGERVRYNEARGLRKLRRSNRFIIMRKHLRLAEPLPMNDALQLEPASNRNCVNSNILSQKNKTTSGFFATDPFSKITNFEDVQILNTHGSLNKFQNSKNYA